MIALRRAADVKAGHLTEDKLALWLAADVAVTTDSAGRVISWQDIVYGDNKSGEDAIQVDEKARPLLVKDAIHGRPGIRFDGESDYLLTTPLETTDDQTVMFVCQFGPQAFRKDRKWGGQIINYDGPPNRYLSDTSQPGVLQIGEPLLEEEFKPSLLTGQVFAGFIGSATVESGRVDAVPVGADQPVIVSYVYDYEYEHGKSYLIDQRPEVRRSAGLRAARDYVAEDHRPPRLDGAVLRRRLGGDADLQQGARARRIGPDDEVPGRQVRDQARRVI